MSSFTRPMATSDPQLKAGALNLTEAMVTGLSNMAEAIASSAPSRSL